MSQTRLDDTIVAIATAPGQGGIGIIRLSGKRAVVIADKLFFAKSKKRSPQFKSHTLHYGWIVDRRKPHSARHQTNRESRPPAGEAGATNYEIIDEALLAVMRAPKSYTKEDVVEISCHGGIVALRKTLNLAVASGARLAEPGEFTKRAFLNGRIDLAQAEAVLDIIQSKTDAFLKVSMNQLKGDLTLELEAIREILMGIYTEIEAIVNFPEDDIDASGRTQISDKINSGYNRIQKLLETSEHGRILKDGIKVVLCGKPNVGKSSLLNVLLKQPRAIVTEIAGTTRDTIEETAQIKGIPFQLVDTAGILEPRDLVEKEAIKRSCLSIDSADLILLVLDGSNPLSAQDSELMDRLREKNMLVVINKCDLPLKIKEKKVKEAFKNKKILRVSALNKTAIDQLEDAVVENVWHGKAITPHGILVSNARHIHSLKESAGALQRALKSFRDNASLEFISEEIKMAVNHLDNITGRHIDIDLLEKIFSEFCIGK